MLESRNLQTLADAEKSYKRYNIPQDTRIVELQHTIIKNGELISNLPSV